VMCKRMERYEAALKLGERAGLAIKRLGFCDSFGQKRGLSKGSEARVWFRIKEGCMRARSSGG
jgi:hypothetical protein